MLLLRHLAPTATAVSQLPVLALQVQGGNGAQMLLAVTPAHSVVESCFMESLLKYFILVGPPSPAGAPSDTGAPTFEGCFLTG